jgi:hypothetical protein
MKKTFLCVVLGLLCSVVSLVAQEQPKEKPPLNWGCFFDVGGVYNYEYGESTVSDFTIKFGTSNLFGEFGAGYYFGGVTMRCYLNVGTSIFGESLFSDGKHSITDTMNVLNLKIGADIGIKLFQKQNIGLFLPLGYYFTRIMYTAKDPILIADYSTQYAVERRWIFEYHTIYSGLDAELTFNKHISLVFYGHIGYPIVSNLKFELVAPSNYVWTSTGKRELTVEYDASVFSASAGVLLRIKLSNTLGSILLLPK